MTYILTQGTEVTAFKLTGPVARTKMNQTWTIPLNCDTLVAGDFLYVTLPHEMRPYTALRVHMISVVISHKFPVAKPLVKPIKRQP